VSAKRPPVWRWHIHLNKKCLTRLIRRHRLTGLVYALGVINTVAGSADPDFGSAAFSLPVADRPFSIGRVFQAAISNGGHPESGIWNPPMLLGNRLRSEKSVSAVSIVSPSRLTGAC
jgi:hypothetical protein